MSKRTQYFVLINVLCGTLIFYACGKTPPPSTKVSVGKQGVLLWNDFPTTLKEITVRSSELTKAKRNDWIQLQCDCDTPVSAMQDAIAALHEGGCRIIEIHTFDMTNLVRTTVITVERQEEERKAIIPEKIKRVPDDQSGQPAAGDYRLEDKAKSQR
jgi:hypothetical protein